MNGAICDGSSRRRASVCPLAALLVAIPAHPGFFQPENSHVTYSIGGPCGETVEGAPGSLYDDGTGGSPYFDNGRPGYNWEVVLTRAENPARYLIDAWYWAVGVEGETEISDISLEDTLGPTILVASTCARPFILGCYHVALTGAPWGGGPQTQENRGAVSWVQFGTGPIGLEDEGSFVIARVRVTGRFPEVPGDVAPVRLFFAERTGESGIPVANGLHENGDTVSPDTGDPPLALEDCVVYLKAVEVARFIRCDPNADGKLEISDAIWIVQELFRGGPETACPAAADCDADGERNVTDAIYALNYVFFGGPPPPLPYPECGRVEGLGPEDCPLETTSCPLLGR